MRGSRVGGCARQQPGVGGGGSGMAGGGGRRRGRRRGERHGRGPDGLACAVATAVEEGYVQAKVRGRGGRDGAAVLVTNDAFHGCLDVRCQG